MNQFDYSRFEYVFQHGVYSQTAEACDVSIGSDGYTTGSCAFEGELMREASAVPVALPAESVIRKACVDGDVVDVNRVSPGIFSIALPASASEGSACNLELEYEGVFTDGVSRDTQGGGWFELQCMTIWKPVFGFDPTGRTRSRGRLEIPASCNAAVGMGNVDRKVDGDQAVIEWNTGSHACADYSFVLGEGDWAHRRCGETELCALVMRGVPYGTPEALGAAEKLVSLYGSLWGDYPFNRLSLACPPTSVSGNCARDGLIIAGMVQDRSPATAGGFGILAHEVAHQWWGNSVYFNWTQLGLVEPLAAYGADRAMRHYFPENRLAGLEAAIARAKQAEQAGVPLIDCTWSTPDSSYLRESKGSCVWHLLEKLAGTQRLDSALHQFASDFRGRYAGTDDVRAVFRNAGGDDGDRMFADYVLGTKPIPDTPDAYLV